MLMEKLISPSNSSFLKGRLLVDDVVAVNELEGIARNSKMVCLVFKIDFEKAYDLVSWNFLD